LSARKSVGDGMFLTEYKEKGEIKSLFKSETEKHGRLKAVELLRE